jgi:hypothetical protein
MRSLRALAEKPQHITNLGGLSEPLAVALLVELMKRLKLSVRLVQQFRDTGHPSIVKYLESFDVYAGIAGAPSSFRTCARRPHLALPALIFAGVAAGVALQIAEGDPVNIIHQCCACHSVCVCVCVCVKPRHTATACLVALTALSPQRPVTREQRSRRRRQ